MRKGLFAALFALVTLVANVGFRSDLFSIEVPAETGVVMAAEKPVEMAAAAPAAKLETPKVEVAKSEAKRPTRVVVRNANFVPAAFPVMASFYPNARAKSAPITQQQARELREISKQFRIIEAKKGRVEVAKVQAEYQKAMRELQHQLVALKHNKAPYRVIVKTNVPDAPDVNVEVPVAPAVPEARLVNFQAGMR